MVSENRREAAEITHEQEAALDAVSRLALVARSLNAGGSVRDVVEILLRQGMALLGADGAVFAVEQHEDLHPLVTLGDSRDVIANLGPIRTDAPVPIAASARERCAIWLGDRAATQTSFPLLRSNAPAIEAWAALPVELDEELVGVFGFSFRHSQEFDETHRLYARTLVDMSARPLVAALGRERSASLAQHDDRQVDDDVSTMLAAVSHDLRAPLAAIELNAGTLERLLGDGTPATTVAGSIRHDIRNIQHVVIQLGEAMVSANEVRREPMDLLHAVRHVVADATDATVTLTSDAERTTINANRFQVERLVANLIDNASRHGTSTITIHCTGDAGIVTLTVDDDGPGIPADRRELVFERSESSSVDPACHGLGLHLVRTFARSNGGVVSAGASRSGGARFAVSFPVHATDGDRPSGPSSESRSTFVLRQSIARVSGQSSDDHDSIARRFDITVERLGLLVERGFLGDRVDGAVITARDGLQLVLIATVGNLPPVPMNDRPVVPLTSGLPLCRSARLGTAEVLRTRSALETTSPWLAAIAPRAMSAISVPLRNREILVGSLGVTYLDDDASLTQLRVGVLSQVGDLLGRLTARRSVRSRVLPHAEPS